MPPEGGGPGSPRDWLRRARSNLARAALGRATPDVLLEDYEEAIALARAVFSWASGFIIQPVDP